MKRYSLSYPILSILIVLFFILIPRHAISQVYRQDRSIEPRVVINGKVIESPKTNFETYCYYVSTGEIVPCHFKVKIDEAHEENDCQGAANTACGHQDGKHTISRSKILENKDTETARILGGFTDAQEPNISTALPERKDQLVYSYDYYSGEISGKITITAIATLSDNVPGSFVSACESRRVCTAYRNIKVEYCGDSYFCDRFVELERPTSPPLLPDPLDWSLYWDGYVRCGMGSACNVPDNIITANWLDYDKPYNWPAHPTTNWGQWQFLDQLKILARTWYLKFSKPLVINDISLPKGGLLDCEPTDQPNWKTPHASHRKGIEADILSMSVPKNMRPTGGRTDKRWKKLYEDYGLLDEVDLIYSRNPLDYNHLMYTGGNTQY